jgi:AcrR family transcriptional regulator
MESDPRMERLLDAAGELVLRWGYNRVTIEDIARRARIGKGTVYLHFRTKDALFLALLLRAQQRNVAKQVDRMRADPICAMPSRLCAAMYLDVVADPVLRAIYLGDAEVLGRLTHEAEETLGQLAAERSSTLRTHFDLLRTADALRTDLDVEVQLHVMVAVVTGFFHTDAQPGAPADPQVRADLVRRTIADALEVPDPSPAALVPVVDRMVPLYTSLIDRIGEEWRRRVR